MTESGNPGPIPVMRPFIGEEEAEAAAAAIRSGWVAQGPRVKAVHDPEGIGRRSWRAAGENIGHVY